MMRAAALTCALLLAASLTLAGGQCQEYELLVKEGLKAGQSLSIRTFGFKKPPHYDDEPIGQFTRAFAESLRTELLALGRFGRVETISAEDTPKTDLVLEGLFARLDEGSRWLRVITPSVPFVEEKAAAKMSVSGVIRASSSGANVAWFRCTSSTWGGLLGTGGIFARGGKTLIHSRARKISKQIAATIAKSDRKPAAGKPPARW